MKRSLAVLAAALLFACATTSPRGGTGVFRDVTRDSGIQFRFRADLQRLKMITTVTGGCAFGDADADGRPDLYVTNSVRRWGKSNTSCGRLYRNAGGGRFEDVTDRSGIRACGLGMGSFWVDLDGDADLDLYLTNVGPNQLFVNRGDGTFEEARGSGLEDPLFSIGAAFLDHDADGDVDVVVANYLDSTPEWESSQPQFELRVPEDYIGQPSRLYRNEGKLRFVDVTAEAGLALPPAETKTLGVAVLDYDGDGQPDLYFVNDRVSNRLFRNAGGGRFEERTAETGAGVLGAQPRAGMGVAVGDADGDGGTDLFVTNFGAEPNSYYRNVEGTIFEDAGAVLGGGDVGLSWVRWGTHFVDFDHDGWPDLYAVGGHLAPQFARILGHYKSGKAAYVEAGDSAYRQGTVLLRNLGGGRFEEWREAGDLGRLRMSGRGSAVADVDDDGDLDLFVVDLAGPSRLFENVAGSRRGSWLRVEPRTGSDGRTVLGTRISVTAGGRTQVREFQVSPSYASGTLTDLHFGLGDAETCDVEVRWPDGERGLFEGVATRGVYRLSRKEGLVRRPPVTERPSR